MRFIFELTYGRLNCDNEPNGRPYMSLRLGRWELFAKRETASATRYGITREGRGAGILDLPGWSISWAS